MVPPPWFFSAPSGLRAITVKEGTRESIKNQTDVALRLTKQLLLTEGKDKNIVYSPLSIHVVLSMIATGSQEGHPHQEQMLKFLKSTSTEQLNDLASELVPLVFADGSPSGGPCLSFANGVWTESSLTVKPSFKQVMDNAYNAALKQVDFKYKPDDARCKVISWAEKETRGLIKELLPPGTVTSFSRVILANALYFKGAWDQKFHKSLTRMFDFHLLNGSSVKARFMTNWDCQYASVFDGFKVLKLPYAQGGDLRKFSMYVYLPHAMDGLPALMERVCSEAGFLDRYVPCRAIQVNPFIIPKFKITFGCEVLEDLGLELPLLSETVDGAAPKVNLLMHKLFVEVNEEDTEAAAATAIECSAGPPPEIERIDFVADHPFLFLIREEATGAVTFIGHVLNPIAD